MGHSMLGPHVNWPRDQIAWLARARPRVGKVLLQDIDLAWMRAAKATSPDTFWVGRIVPPAQPLDSPVANAQDFTQRLLLPAAEPYRGLIDALEGYNEVGFTNFRPSVARGVVRPSTAVISADLFQQARQEMQRYALFERTRAELLAAQGWKSVVGNFSAGSPELELWPDFYPALEAGDYLGLHEYSANRQPPYLAYLETWLCRRYRRVYAQLPANLRIPLIITECGIDGGAVGDPQQGWRRYTNAAGYLAELRWYDEGLQADSARYPIVGATVFCYGHLDANWDTFDIGGEMTNMLADYMQANPPEKWEEPVPAPPDTTLVEMLSAEFGAEFDDVRQQLVHVGEFPKRDLTAINYLVLDHTGVGTTPATWSNTIARLHVENNGWPAIGYHFLVYPHKVRYAGSLDTARPAVWGRDAETVIIALVGNFNDTAPAAATIHLTRRLTQVLGRYLARTVPVVGHREIALPGHASDGPGATAYGENGWIKQIQQAAQGDDVAQLKARIAELEALLAAANTELDALRAKIAQIRAIVD